MSIKKFHIVPLFIILSLLIGSATSIVGAQSDPESGTDPTALVYFKHLAPFAADLEDTSVTIRVDGVDVITDLEYGKPPAQTPGLLFSAGDHLVEVIPTGSMDPAISETVTLEAGLEYSIPVIGNGTNQPLELFQLEDDVQAIDTHAKLRIAHVAPVGSNPADTLVDICTDAGEVFMGLTGVAYKDFTDPYLLLPEGEYDLMVAASDGTCGTVLYDIPSLWFKKNQLADLYVTGDLENQPLDHNTITGLLYVKKGFVRIAHYALFTENPADTSVTVKVDGETILENFLFKDVTAYLDLDTGDHLVQVYPTGSDTAVIEQTITLEAYKYYTAGVIGDIVNQPLEIYALEDDTVPPDVGAKLRIVHAAPVAADIDDTRVDICTNMGTIFQGLANIPYKAFTDPYLEIPAGDYDLYVTAPDGTCQNVLFDIPPFRLAENGIYDLWIIDHFDVGCPGWVCEIEMSYVNLANVAPFEENFNLTGITIIFDGMPEVTDFKFLSFSGYKDLLPGEHSITIKQTATDFVLAQETVTFGEDKYYTLHLIGDGTRQPTEMFLLEDDVTPLAVGAKIRLVHVAPIATDIEDTKADICTFEDQIYGGLTGIPYKAYSDPYMVFDAGYYRFKAAKTNSACQDSIAGLQPFLLENGDIGSVYIFGDTKYPTGMTSWPDLSPYTIFLDTVGINFAPYPIP